MSIEVDHGLAAEIRDPVSIRELMAIGDKAASIIEEFSLVGPISIKFSAALSRGHHPRDPHLRIEAGMRTADRDDPKKPITVVMERLVSIRAIVDFEGINALEQFLQREVRSLAIDLWSHEFDELFQHKGKRLVEHHDGSEGRCSRWSGSRLARSRSPARGGSQDTPRSSACP
jgi:hypothetical protein